MTVGIRLDHGPDARGRRHALDELKVLTNGVEMNARGNRTWHDVLDAGLKAVDRRIVSAKSQ
jgi:hypothetical protein